MQTLDYATPRTRQSDRKRRWLGGVWTAIAFLIMCVAVVTAGIAIAGAIVSGFVTRR